MFKKYDLIINQNKRCRDYGIYISERVAMPIAQMEYEDISIIGRNGLLTKEKGYLDKEITVNFNFFDPHSIIEKMRYITTLFSTAKEIIFTDDDEVYYKVKKVSIGDISREIRHYGFFTVTFTVDPFSYNTRVFPLIITKSDFTFKNPANYYSLPNIKIYGDGDITVTINKTTTKFTGVENYIEIDCELMETYKGEELQNFKKVGEYFRLETGINSISFIGNVEKIEIDPRWRWL